MSHQTTDPSGFTLLEVIITVAIIAAIVAMAFPRLGGRNSEIKSTVRKLAILSRDLRSRAKLNNATYRLVIDMGDSESASTNNNKIKTTYWVERAQGEVLNDYDPKNPPKLPSKDETKEKKEDEELPSLFSPDPKIFKKPQELPPGLIIESVELVSAEDPITSGLVYIYYLPTGFVDEAAIHLKHGEKIAWTLATEPLTGRMDIVNENRKLEDLKSK